MREPLLRSVLRETCGRSLFPAINCRGETNHDESESRRAFVCGCQDVHTEDEYVAEVTRRYVGRSGFMLFAEIDHGGWLAVFGIRRRTVRVILGNPLIAVTMIRHDITAGLFAPVELLITEHEDGRGTNVVYVRPSSLIVLEENKPLRRAAEALDVKLAALVTTATGVDVTSTNT